MGAKIRLDTGSTLRRDGRSYRSFAARLCLRRGHNGSERQRALVRAPVLVPHERRLCRVEMDDVACDARAVP